MKFSQYYTGIVIGVACAALFSVLSIITFSHIRGTLLCQQSPVPVSGSDDEVDAFQDAPPSYREGK